MTYDAWKTRDTDDNPAPYRSHFECDDCGKTFSIEQRTCVGGAGGWELCPDCTDLGECDCCGKMGHLSRGWASGVETFACEDCRS